VDQAKLDRAAALEAEAAKLRREAFDQRPLPDHWRVGQTVRYLNNQDWAWSAGGIAKIVEIGKDYVGQPAREYAVFWTSSDNGKTHRFWTTPSDVELVKDVATKTVAA
jgi:hypothetical protein